MNTPSGLRRYSRSMITRFAGTCEFCAQPTKAGIDFAATTGNGWVAVCASCATSIPAQVRALVLRIETAAATLTAEQLLPIAQALPDLSVAVQDNAPEAVAYDALVRLQATLAAVTALTTVTVANPLGDALQAVADNAQATPKHREVALSMLGQISKGRTLSEKQISYADSIVKSYTAGAPSVASTTSVTPGIYVVGTDHYLVKESKAGNLYAMVRTSTLVAGQKLVWEYTRGALGTVATGHRITADEAAAIGHATHTCCFCGLTLTTAESTAVGYGPICASHNGLPWG